LTGGTLIAANRGQPAGDATDGIADTVGHAHAAAVDQHRQQRCAVQQQLHQRQKDDRSERPVEQDDHDAGKFGREHRT
jgi:hypothetical protein